jgi:hypothetical protein
MPSPERKKTSFLLFRSHARVNAHRVKSRGGGLKCAHLRATPLQSSDFGGTSGVTAQRDASVVSPKKTERGDDHVQL